MQKKLENMTSAKKIALRLGVTPATVMRWAKEGRIPSHRLTKKTLRFQLSEVLEALKASAAETSSPGDCEAQGVMEHGSLTPSEEPPSEGGLVGSPSTLQGYLNQI